MSTSGYSNDQFFGIADAGEQLQTTGSSSVGAPNNPPFIYPAREIRTVGTDGKEQLVKMQRGYIRSLITSVEGASVAIRKCAFQFNPQALQTNVRMTENVLNAFQQDPGQFAVPVAANSQFLVALIFDRSMELNNEYKEPGSYIINSDGTLASGSGGATGVENSNLFLDKSPGQIGVFRDIGELNAIIGAGLAPQLEQLYSWNAQKQIVNNAKSLAISDQTKVDSALASANINSGLIVNTNYGNSAFLIPLPVRAVFSSLFIVEGFVNEIDINYTKFTTHMVPMQAYVNLSMTATYIGYAKKSTYTTFSLEQQVTSYTAQQSAIQATVNTFTSALQSKAGFINISLNPDPAISQGPNDASSLSVSEVLGFDYFTRDRLADLSVFAEGLFPKALDDTGALLATDPITTAAGDQGLTATVDGNVSIYGPFSSQGEAFAFSGTPATAAATYAVGGNGEWSTVAQGVVSQHTLPASRLTSADVDGSHYFKIEWTASAVFSIGEQTASGKGQITVITKNLDTSTGRSIPLQWTASVVPGSTTTLVGAPPTPGTTSTVGKPKPGRKLV